MWVIDVPQHSISEETDYETNMMISDLVGNVEIGLTPEQITKISCIIHKTPDVVAEERCPICLESYTKDDIFVRKLCCSHFFCDACILKWLSCHKSCPCCKNVFEENLNQPLTPQLQST